MQTVSQEWKDMQERTLTNRALVNITLDLTNPDMLAGCSVSTLDTTSCEYSQPAQTIEEFEATFPVYASMEQNMWLLDGSRTFLNDSGNVTGYLSNSLSRANGSLSNSRIMFDFSDYYTTGGLVIKWGESYELDSNPIEYAVDFMVEYYDTEDFFNEPSCVQSVHDNDSSETVLPSPNCLFNRVLIEVNEWSLPNRRARVSNVFFGIRESFTNSELMEVVHDISADPLSLELPSQELEFSIDNVTNGAVYDPSNPAGITPYLMERQRVKLSYGFMSDNGTDEMWIKGGRFYLSEWEAPEGGLEASFTASDAFGFMNGTYIKGDYHANGRSLYDLAVDVLTEAASPLNPSGGLDWFIDPSLKTIITTSPLPTLSTKECLQLIANAGKCSLFQARDGSIHIEPISETLQDYEITPNNSYEYTHSSLSNRLQLVEVVVTTNTLGQEGELFNGTFTVDGTEIINVIFSSPGINQTATISGGVIESVEYHARAAIMEITATGDVTIVITGTILDQTQSTVNVKLSDIEGEVVRIENGLIDSVNKASVIGSWVVDYYTNRQSLESTWRADPRLDVFDMISNTDKRNFTRKVLMTDVSYTFSGAFKGKGEGRVYGNVV